MSSSTGTLMSMPRSSLRHRPIGAALPLKESPSTRRASRAETMSYRSIQPVPTKSKLEPEVSTAQKPEPAVWVTSNNQSQVRDARKSEPAVTVPMHDQSGAGFLFPDWFYVMMGMLLGFTFLFVGSMVR